MNSYASLCDDFGVSTYLHGKLEMPIGRETVLHFFEAIQKAFPKMTDFEKRSDDEYLLEEDRDAGSYRWASLDKRRLCAGFVNPPTIEDADAHNERILELAPYHLDLSHMQTESMDVLYYFDFPYQGNHDEVVAEALAIGTPLEGLVQMPAARVLHYQPTLMMALDDACQLQCRLSIETRTSAYQVRTGNFPESPDLGVLHRAAVLGEAAVQDVRGVVPQPAPRARRTGEQPRHPERHQPAGQGDQHQAMRKPTEAGTPAGRGVQPPAARCGLVACR